MNGFDYEAAASRYDEHRRGGGPYDATLAGLARGAPGRDFLELGAGTGNNTRSLYESAPSRLTALEPAAAMVRQAQAKGAPGRWVRGEASRLPFHGGVFDFVYATYVLHHIRNLDALFAECLRVLRPGGWAAMVSVPEGFIANHPMNAYFPSFAKIDLARFQPMAHVVQAMTRAGFRNVGHRIDVSPKRNVDAAYAERIAGRFISTYALLPAEELAQGLARMRRDIAEEGHAGPPIAREAVTFWGECPPAGSSHEASP